MTETIEALFDGVVLRPTEPLALKPNTRVWIVVETTPPATQKASFLRTARALNLEGPADWSANIVMRELKLAEALTTDAHFEQAGFQALLLENSTL